MQRKTWIAGLFAAILMAGTTPANAAEPDPVARSTPVSVAVEDSSGTNKPVKIKGIVAASIGDCSGASNWTERKYRFINQFGETTAWIKMRTNWNYNGSRVTCAASSRSWGISWWATGVSWGGWQDFYEYFYTSGGHPNGGALTYTQGKFRFCPIKCVSTNYPWIETRVYWNGTNLLSSGNVGTIP